MNFISKNAFEILSLHLKVMDKIQRKCLKLSKEMSLPTPFLTLPITFDWRLKNLKRVLGDEN